MKVCGRQIHESDRDIAGADAQANTALLNTDGDCGPFIVDRRYQGGTRTGTIAIGAFEQL